MNCSEWILLNLKSPSQTSTGGHDIAVGDFNYDSTAKKLRFVENDSHSNKTTHMDVLIHFEEVTPALLKPVNHLTYYEEVLKKVLHQKLSKESL